MINHLTFFLIFKFVLAVFFTYRISQILTLDEGPFLVFDRIRQYTDKKKANEQDKEKIGIWTTLDGILHCQYCTGIYAAFIALGLFENRSSIAWMILVWGAIAGLHAFLLDIIDFRGVKE